MILPPPSLTNGRNGLSLAKVLLALFVAFLLPCMALATTIEDTHSVWRIAGKKHTLQISFRVTEPKQQKCELELWTNNALNKVLESKMLGNKPEQSCRFIIGREELPADVSEAAIFVRIGTTMKALRIPPAPALAAAKPSFEFTSVSWTPEAELLVCYRGKNAADFKCFLEMKRGNTRVAALAQVDFPNHEGICTLKVPFDGVKDYEGCHVQGTMGELTRESGLIPPAPKPVIVIERLSWNSMKELELRTLVTAPQGKQAVVELWHGKRKLRDLYTTTLSMTKTTRIDLGIPITTIPELVGCIMKIRVGTVTVSSSLIEAPQ